jgi:hypothetical protein
VTRLLIQISLTISLSAAGEQNASLFQREVRHAAATKGITNVAVIVNPQPPDNSYLAKSRFNDEVQWVLIRVDVLETASPALLKFLAYHEVCHIYLWRARKPDTEADVDDCAHAMFFSRREWGRAMVARDHWRPK